MAGRAVSFTALWFLFRVLVVAVDGEEVCSLRFLASGSALEMAASESEDE